MKKKNLVVVMLALALVFALVFGVVACGDPEEEKEKEPENTPPTAEEEVENYFGSYKTTYQLLSGTMQEEFVEFNKTTFSIFEKTAAGAKKTTDYLDFVISEWDFATALTGYENGFKFTGYISDGKTVHSTADAAPNPKNIYGYKTAPNFEQADITNKTPAWMSIYFTASGDFVRTAFSKPGFDQSVLVTGGETPTPLVRVYKKQ